MKTLPILLALISLTLAAGAAKKDELYRSGQRDLDAGQWTQAIQKFGQVAQKRGEDADGALYWKAYAEHKAGRAQQALSTIRQLSGAYPKSKWLDDARTLAVEIRGGSADGAAAPAAGGPDDDEELKLYALNGLLASQPDRAVPTLQKFLQGKHSQRLKEQALFVLSQSDAPEAQTTLQAVARGTAHADLQQKAIEYLGIAGGDENLRVLDDMYRTGRSDLKQSVLDAYLVADQNGRMLAVAKDGKDPLQGHAIELLGAMEAKEELRQLYQADASPRSRLKVLEAMGVAGDVETLIDTARREQDAAVRNKAIEGLGINSGAKAAEALRALYASSSDAAIRRAVVEALFVQDNAHALIEIFGTEKDREMRKHIVQQLSLMDSDEAAQFLEKIYSN